MFAIFSIKLQLEVMKCKTIAIAGKSISLAVLICCALHAKATLAQANDTDIVNEPQAADDLRAAILRIGKSPTDSNALYDAGDASLRVGDAIVALDFFTRADRLTPNSSRIKSGMAKAQLALKNPIEALRLFEVASALGASLRDIAFDRGLAFDLVGNFSRAQQDYAVASSTLASNELTIRQAISFSLSGNHEYADSLLLPLLRANDASAWRARAFLLAARGKDKESFKIAQGFLSNKDAQNLRPYLKSMDKLTGAQQAAAVHFGHFPTSNQIGKDSDNIRIASQSSQSLAQALNANRLQPSGDPLGLKRLNKKEALPKIKASGQEDVQPNIRLSRLSIVDDPKIRISGLSATQLSEIKSSNISTIQRPEQTTASASASESASVSSGVIASTAQKPAITDSVQALPPMEIASSATTDKGQASTLKISNNDETSSASAVVFEDAAVTAPANKELDLRQFIQAIEVSGEDNKKIEAVDLASIKEEQRIKRQEQKRALALKQAKDREKAAARKKRDKEQKAEAEKNKARYWVQIATGRDINALKYDYRRISRKQSELFSGISALTSKWGRTNRLVVGPFDNLSAAKKFESGYRKGGGDGFVWRSGNGTIVTPLK